MKRMIIAFAAILAVAAAGASIAQDHSGHSHAEAALAGHCPVAYVEMNKAVKGDPHIALEFAGHNYVFANADAKKMFQADPNKYLVAYNGLCATAVSMGKKLDGDPTMFEVREGTTYLFSSAKAKKMYDAEPAKVIAKADDQWTTLNPAYGGHCPVAYIEMNKPVAGSADLALDQHGTRILFANADAKKMYEAKPGKYQVAYDGHCATAVSMGKKFATDPTIFTVKDGKTYLFSSAMAKKMFDAEPEKVVTMADKQWASLN